MEILSSDLDIIQAYFFDCKPNDSAPATQAGQPNAAVGQEVSPAKSFQIPEQSVAETGYDSRPKTDLKQHDLFTKDGQMIR